MTLCAGESGKCVPSSSCSKMSHLHTDVPHHVLYPQGHLFKVPRAFPHTEVLAPELSAWLFSLTSTYAKLKATLYKLRATCTPQLWTNPCSSAQLWSPKGLVGWGLPGFRSCLDLHGQRAGPAAFPEGWSRLWWLFPWAKKTFVGKSLPFRSVACVHLGLWWWSDTGT